MAVRVIMVGMDLWEEFTYPAIQSILEHEPDADLLVIDHGKEPYPPVKGVEILRLDAPVSYPRALNIGISHKKADWYFTMNNDILCLGKFLYMFDGLPQGLIHCPKIHERNGYKWFDNCFVAISDWVWGQVGEFDENFKVCAFEDADYSFRAQALEFDVTKTAFPFFHNEGHTRWRMPKYGEIRMDNLKYLEQKWQIQL